MLRPCGCVAPDLGGGGGDLPFAGWTWVMIPETYLVISSNTHHLLVILSD